MFHLCQAMACLALWSLAASAADFSKIDHRIAKEPVYETKTPKYCLLVFGPEAKHRVWLVLDGDTLYVDKNGNGDLTEEGERIKAPAFTPSTSPFHTRERSIEIGDLSADGLTHTNLMVTQLEFRRNLEGSTETRGEQVREWQAQLDSIWRRLPDGIVYTVSINLDPKCYGLFGDVKGRRVKHSAYLDQDGWLAFAGRPADAPIIHLGGPLTMHARPGQALRRGPDPEETRFWLGTQGLGPGTFVIMCYDLVPKQVQPTVEVQFPPKEPGQKPVTRKYDLQRC
jgi:hypothetical protein